MLAKIDRRHHVWPERRRRKVDRPLAVRRQNRRMLFVRGGGGCVENDADICIDWMRAEPIEAAVGSRDPEPRGGCEAFARRIEPDQQADFDVSTAPDQLDRQVRANIPGP